MASRNDSPALAWPRARAVLIWASAVTMTVALVVVEQGVLHAQQRGRGAGGRGGNAPATAQAAAPIDLTGYWVSVVTEDWLWRMKTPPKGDRTSVPLNAEGIRVTDAWSPEQDEAAGEQCRAYGAPALLRIPGRLHITWKDPNTLQIDADAGTQTRELHFDSEQLPEGWTPTWQGFSAAQWPVVRGRARGVAAEGRPQTLKVVTKGLRPGYLRKNGVPYSGNAVLTEYFNRLDEPDGSSWMIVTTIVEDPTYLNIPFAVSNNFKKVADQAGWTPTACSAR